MVQNLKWAIAHLSRRLGVGALGVGRWGVGARRRGRWGTGLGAGQEGVWQALGVRGRASGRCRQLGARALQAAGRGAGGRAAGGAPGRLSERQQARGTR